MISIAEVPKKKKPEEREPTVIGEKKFYGKVPLLIPKKRKPRVDPQAASTSGTSIEVPGASPEPVVIEPTLGGKFPKTVPVGVPLDVSET